MGDGLAAIAIGILAILYTGWVFSRGRPNGHTAVLMFLGVCFVGWGIWHAVASLL